MAQVNSRGTLTRGRWDYFELTNAIACVFGNVPSGGIGCYFANNSAGAVALDIYNVTWFASVMLAWDVWLLAPPLVLTPIAPTQTSIFALQPDRPMPAGALGMYNAGAGTSYRLQRISNATNSESLEPIAGSFLVTLPPGWAIAVGGNAGTNPAELSMTVWYQEVLDNIAPAR